MSPSTPKMQTPPAPSLARRICPRCGSAYLERISRRLIDKLVGLFVSLKRYQCTSCGWRGNLRMPRD